MSEKEAKQMKTQKSVDKPKSKIKPIEKKIIDITVTCAHNEELAKSFYGFTEKFIFSGCAEIGNDIRINTNILEHPAWAKYTSSAEKGSTNENRKKKFGIFDSEANSKLN